MAPEGPVEVMFYKYTFFKTAREWRSLEEGSKEAHRREFLRVLADTGLNPSCFSLVGFRGDVDFMILMESPKLEAFQSALSSLLATGVGRYLDVPYSYLAMTRRSKYLGSHTHPGQEGEGGSGWTNAKYIFVYPFIKKREWYRLPFVDRQRMMAEHFKVGHSYPDIKIHTGYSFGLDDQEFVLAFEGDDPARFLALVEELRGSEASMYTELETPIFTCRRMDPSTMLALLG
ncbi:MAG: chlorite dismutase family protein [Nitrososphaerota archaeon]|nr:chlorite dismutase family protein [Nitrososphaerota archaeon]